LSRQPSAAAAARSFSPSRETHASTERFEVMIFDPRWRRWRKTSEGSSGSPPQRAQAEIVDDREVGCGEPQHPARQAVVGSRGAPLREHRGRGDEQHAVPVAPGAVAQRLADVALPPAARPNERGDLVARQVVACRQLHDAVAQNLRVELEVERLQRPDLLERGAPDAQIERFGRPALGLVAEQPVAELPGVEVLVGHLPDAQREGREDAGEVQLLEQAGQVFSAAPGSSPAGGR
jgi:hypothetical protein